MPKQKVFNWESTTQKLFNELIIIIQDTKAFVYKQTPDILKQLLKFKAFEYSLYALFRLGVVILIISVGIVIFIFARGIDMLWGTIAGGAILFIFSLWALTILGDFVKQFIKIFEIIIAPKIFLIEFLTDWMKKR